MSKLGTIHFREFDKFLRKVGCQFVRQKGSHRIYHRSDLIRPLVVPAKSTVSVLVVKSNLKTLGIAVEDYLKLLDTL